MSTITRRGYHLPIYRLSTGTIRDQWGSGTNGIKAKAVQATDDDAVTLGLQTARDVLDDHTDVDAVVFASTTPGYQYGSTTPTLCEALELSADTYTITLSESVRAGTAAIGVAHDIVDSNGGTALVVAAEVPQPDPGTDREKTAGAGAAALLVESGTDSDGLTQVARATNTRSVLEEWQAPDDPVRHQADNRFARDWGYVAGIENATKAVLSEAGWATENLDALIVQQPNPKFVSRVGQTLGLGDGVITAPEFVVDNGNLGAASAPAVLSQLDASDGDRVVLASYGSGIADAIAYEATATISGQLQPNDSEEIDYMEYLTLTNNLKRQ